MSWTKSPDLINNKINDTFTNWDDLRVPVTATTKRGAKDPDFNKVLDTGSDSTGVWTYLFDKTNEEELFFAVQLPHSYKFGTNLHPHIHWSPVANGAGSVTWGLEYTIANFGSVFPNTNIIHGTTPTPDDSSLVADKHYITNLEEIDGSDITSVSTMLICRVFRDADGVLGTDDYNDDAALLEIDFHYEIDSLGSQLEYVKKDFSYSFNTSGSIKLSGAAEEVDSNNFSKTGSGDIKLSGAAVTEKEDAE